MRHNSHISRLIVYLNYDAAVIPFYHLIQKEKSLSMFFIVTNDSEMIFSRYYYNKVTKQSKWTLPEELKVLLLDL